MIIEMFYNTFWFEVLVSQNIFFCREGGNVIQLCIMLHTTDKLIIEESAATFCFNGTCVEKLL